MPDFYKGMEIVLYAVLNFLPYLILALYPFKRSLRCSKGRIILLSALVLMIQTGLLLWAVLFFFSGRGILSAASTAVYFIFYFWAVKAHPGKILFTLLMLSNIADFVVVCSKCIEGQIFPALAKEQYRWSFSLVMAAVQIVILLPLFIYIKRVYTKAVKKEAGRSAWRYLWLIPATFYVIWFYHLYGSGETSLEAALMPSHSVFLFCIDLGAFLIYHIVTMLINEYGKNMTLEKQNHMLSLENLQYHYLQNKMIETRKARHDMRHHAVVMEGYLRDEKYEELKTYLEGWLKTLPEDSSVIFCPGYTLNLLLLYFAQQAKEHDIDFTVHAALPEEIGIAGSDLSVILGNLLENAVDACAAQKSKDRRIIFRGKTDRGALYFTIDNTMEGELRRDKEGRLLSVKHEGPGLGLESVRDIVSRYNGVLRTEQKGGVFCASVFLNI